MESFWHAAEMIQLVQSEVQNDQRYQAGDVNEYL